MWVKRGFPLDSLQSGSAITLDSPGFIGRVCAVCLWGSSMKGYCQHRHLLVSDCPRHPSGYVLVTLANLSSLLPLPPSETDAGSQGPLGGPLNTLPPATRHLWSANTHAIHIYTHTRNVFSLPLKHTHTPGALTRSARGGEGLTGAGSS